MSILKLALRNLLRNKLRTALTLAAVVFGVSGIILSGGFVHDMYIQLGEALIHSQSGHLQVARQGYFTKGSGQPEAFRIVSPGSTRSIVASNHEVDDVMARLGFAGLATTGQADRPVIGEGVEAESETRLSTHLRVVAGRALNGSDRFAAMVGQGVAQALALKPGDRMDLLVNATDGALNTLEFDVVGVFQTFSRDYDARAVRIPLAAAQELVGTQGATTLVVTLKRTADTERTAHALRQQLHANGMEIRTWTELNDFYGKTVTLYDQQFGVLQAIVLVMVVLGVGNSINILAFERLGEFGTMMALGNRPRDVFRLILVESAMLGLVGAMLGVIVGVAIAWLVSHVGIPMPPPPNANLGYLAYIRIVPSVVVLALAVGVIATLLAGLAPAIRIARTPIVTALQANV